MRKLEPGYFHKLWFYSFLTDEYVVIKDGYLNIHENRDSIWMRDHCFYNEFDMKGIFSMM